MSNLERAMTLLESAELTIITSQQVSALNTLESQKSMMILVKNLIFNAHNELLDLLPTSQKY